MASNALDFSRLAAPAEHGGVLVEPAAPELPPRIARNQEQTHLHDFTVYGIPSRELRNTIRQRVAGETDRPIIVTGHQPDFFHAGVWAKQVVAARLAEAVGGVAVNLVVDHDAPTHTALDVPHVHDGAVRVDTINYAQWPASAAFENIPTADRDASATLASAVRDALGEKRYRVSLLPTFFDAYAAAADAPRWVDQVVAARRAVDHHLGIDVIDRAVSTVWCGPLMGELITNARRFAAAYNDALAEYRRRNDISQDTRPLPDLGLDHDRAELAMWAYRPGEQRRRLFIRDAKPTLELFAGDERIAALDRDCRDWKSLCRQLEQTSPWCLRPRALTLTLWARLFVADLFIHGIGGAKYDRITDDLIRRYFNIEPPAMACVSATLRLDLPTHPLEPGAVQAARRRIRDAEFNPQYFVSRPEAPDAIATREKAVAESDRLRHQDPRNRTARRHVFNEIRDLNERIAAHRPDLRATLCNDLQRLLRWRDENAGARRRDFFFAIHPSDELLRLLDNLPGVHDFAA